jgi:hypothetical protein
VVPAPIGFDVNVSVKAADILSFRVTAALALTYDAMRRSAMDSRLCDQKHKLQVENLGHDVFCGGVM